METEEWCVYYDPILATYFMTCSEDTVLSVLIEDHRARIVQSFFSRQNAAQFLAKIKVAQRCQGGGEVKIGAPCVATQVYQVFYSIGLGMYKYDTSDTPWCKTSAGAKGVLLILETEDEAEAIRAQRYLEAEQYRQGKSCVDIPDDLIW